MSLPDEDLWYCKQNGYYRMPESLPDDLVDRLMAQGLKLLRTDPLV